MAARLLGMLQAMTRVAALWAKSDRGHLADRLAGAPFAHPDENDALSDRHDVAALERGGGEILVGIAEPEAEVAALEDRMKLVDRPLQQGLQPPRRPVHRIAGHAPIDPAGRVALEEGVGDRRNEKRRLARGVGQHLRPLGLGNIQHRDAPDEQPRQVGAAGSRRARAASRGRCPADGVGRHAPVEDEGARLLVVQRFAEELREIEHLDAPFLHLRHEVVMVLARLVNPDDVVEQQIVAVAGGEPLMGAARRADHHRLQLSDLGVDAETASHETSLYLLA